MAENDLQDQIRLALAGVGTFFRANVGMGWQGIAVKKTFDTLILRQPRPFRTGLPTGFSDLFGMTPVTITPEMVGQTVAIFTAIEVKTARRKVTEDQQRFLDAVNRNGGIAFVARGLDDLAPLKKMKY